MSALYLVRLTVAPRELAAFAVAHGVSDGDNGYAAHLALRRRYGAVAPQPFRLRMEHPDRTHLLGYVADPTALMEAYALPSPDDLLNTVFPQAPVFRAMPENWAAGARYGFQVRVRPVVRYGARARQARAERQDAWQRKAGEVDAFVAACERMPGETMDREQVYHDWLAARLAGVAKLEQADLVSFRRVRTRRSSHGRPGAGSVEGPEAVMRGTLQVEDGTAFLHLLARGVGRHAAFGYGMLLLSPAGQR